jgi:hypothetical protein
MSHFFTTYRYDVWVKGTTIDRHLIMQLEKYWGNFWDIFYIPITKTQSFLVPLSRTVDFPNASLYATRW